MKNLLMANILCSLVVLVFAAGTCSAQSLLYFPHFVDGSQTLQVGNAEWGSLIVVTNSAGPGTPAASGTITLTRDDGTPMNVTLMDGGGGPSGNTFLLAGGQTKFFVSPNLVTFPPKPFNGGFATVTSNVPVSGGLTFIEFARIPHGTIAVAGIPAATPLMRQAIPAVVSSGNPQDNTVPTNNTGVAVANPGSGTATITFQLVDFSGASVVPQVTKTLAANNHTAFFFSDLFPGAPSPFGGMLRIISDKAIVSTALFFQDNAFGAGTVIPLQ
jgi:hypothetical protein